MRLLTRLPKILLVGGMVCAGLFVATPAAQAAITDCGDTFYGVCLWDYAGFDGGPNVRVPANTGGTPQTTNVSAAFNDHMTSWSNNSYTRDARWFYNANGTGTTRCMNPNSSNSNVGWLDNDELSSVVTYTNANACT